MNYQMENINVLTVKFKNDIRQDQIPLLRGAIIHAMDETNILFHNHEEDGFRYLYPLIQYKRINGCAAIVCIGDGTVAIGDFFANCNLDVRLGDEEVETLQVDRVDASKVLIQPWDDMFSYHLRKWLPLNSTNFVQFQQTEGVVERCAMLQRILTGNILSMAKGLGIHFDKEVKCVITNIDEQRMTNYKGTRMTSIDLVFSSNVSLPDYIGLGKGVSTGHGIVTKIKK